MGFRASVNELKYLYKILLSLCFSQFSHCYDKIPDKRRLGKSGERWLTAEGAVRHGAEGVVVRRAPATPAGA